ncbi:MAG: hypothetical protein HRT61_14210 [Ekhidna sp.]|nr:hypothetical protein [Ekhidna sp.]
MLHPAQSIFQSYLEAGLQMFQKQ